MTSQPRNQSKAPQAPITSLQPDWRSLAVVVDDRALLGNKALTLSPPAAAKLRASSAAVDLEKPEAELWQDSYHSIAEEVFVELVTRSGANSRHTQFMPITQRRLRRLLTGFFSERLAASPRLRTIACAAPLRYTLFRSAAAALQRMGDAPPLALATPRLRQEAFQHFSEMPAKNHFLTSPQGKHRFRSTTVNNPPRSYSK